MAYAIATDIQSEFKNITFASGQALTDIQVNEFISQEEATINAIISNRYEIPITGTEAIKIMKNITIAFVAYRVAKILNLKKDVPIPKGFVPQSLNEGGAFIKAMKKLESIRDGKIILRDAVARSIGQGIESYNRENDISPIWKRDTAQW